MTLHILRHLHLSTVPRSNRECPLARVVAIAFVALCVSLAAASGARAQVVEEIDPELADAGYVNDVGMGLTLTGLGITGAGTGLFFGIASGNGFGAAIGGGLLWGIGGLLSLAGIPTWIVGSVRSNILAAEELDRDRVSWSYELAGMVTTLASIGVSLLGIAMLIGGAAMRELDVTGTGGALIPIGVFIGMFIGTPIWAEGARF